MEQLASCCSCVMTMSIEKSPLALGLLVDQLSFF